MIQQSDGCYDKQTYTNYKAVVYKYVKKWYTCSLDTHTYTYVCMHMSYIIFCMCTAPIHIHILVAGATVYAWFKTLLITYNIYSANTLYSCRLTSSWLAMLEVMLV